MSLIKYVGSCVSSAALVLVFCPAIAGPSVMGGGAEPAAAASVSITGAVQLPGSYALSPGERLSEALARAGGLTDSAYPYGAVFLRKSAAEQARATAQVVVQNLIAKCLEQTSLSSDACPRSRILQALNSDRDPADDGRISVVADPAVLALHPDMDPVLESGDSIFIPVRPTTVMVTGAVSHPGNYPYSLTATLDDYVSLAGGFAGNAESDRSFVIYPDGTAKSVETSWLFFRSAAIPPGSAIVVPHQP